MLGPGGMRTMRAGGGGFNPPSPPRGLPAQRPSVVADGHGGHGLQPVANRAQRRKQAALKRVK